MTLADAVRKGAMQRAMGFGRLFCRDGTSCTLGAAYEGTFGAPPDSVIESGRDADLYAELMTAYPLLNQAATCHVCGRRIFGGTMADVVWHLNDDHEWSREQTADWLDTLDA